MENNWVDKFIERLESTPNTIVRDINGDDVLVAIGQGLLSFLIANRIRLGQVSYNTFLGFLDLMSKQKSFEALILIYDDLDVESLLEKYEEDSIKLALVVQQEIADKNFWISFGKQVAGNLISSALSIILKG